MKTMPLMIRLTAAVLLGVSAASHAWGSETPKTVADYRDWVNTLRAATATLLEMNSLSAPGAEIRDEEREQQRLLAEASRITGLRLKSGREEFTATCAWLGRELEMLQAQGNDRNRRAVVLHRISEQLSAIYEEVGRAESETAGPSSDEYKQRLGEILSRSEFRVEPVQEGESWLGSAVRRLLEWLYSLFPEPPSLGPSTDADGITDSALLRGIVGAALLAILIYAGWKLRRFLPGPTGRKRRTGDGQRIVLGELIEEHVDSRRLFAEAEVLAAAGDLRSAIRKGYIALIRGLGDRGLVRLSRNKTNHDYLRELGTDEDLYKEASGLTGIFERHWYGFSETEKRHWDDFRSGYSRVESMNGAGRNR